MASTFDMALLPENVLSKIYEYLSLNDLLTISGIWNNADDFKLFQGKYYIDLNPMFKYKNDKEIVELLRDKICNLKMISINCLPHLPSLSFKDSLKLQDPSNSMIKLLKNLRCNKFLHEFTILNMYLIQNAKRLYQMEYDLLKKRWRRRVNASIALTPSYVFALRCYWNKIKTVTSLLKTLVEVIRLQKYLTKFEMPNAYLPLKTGLELLDILSSNCSKTLKQLNITNFFMFSDHRLIRSGIFKYFEHFANLSDLKIDYHCLSNKLIKRLTEAAKFRLKLLTVFINEDFPVKKYLDTRAWKNFSHKCSNIYITLVIYVPSQSNITLILLELIPVHEIKIYKHLAGEKDDYSSSVVDRIIYVTYRNYIEVLTKLVIDVTLKELINEEILFKIVLTCNKLQEIRVTARRLIHIFDKICQMYKDKARSLTTVFLTFTLKESFEKQMFEKLLKIHGPYITENKLNYHLVIHTHFLYMEEHRFIDYKLEFNEEGCLQKLPKNISIKEANEKTKSQEKIQEKEHDKTEYYQYVSVL